MYYGSLFLLVNTPLLTFSFYFSTLGFSAFILFTYTVSKAVLDVGVGVPINDSKLILFEG